MADKAVQQTNLTKLQGGQENERVLESYITIYIHRNWQLVWMVSRRIRWTSSHFNCIVGIDYITEVMCAIVDKKLSSEIGFKGIFKKILIFTLVGIGNILDIQVIGNGSVFRTAVIFFYLSNVGICLLEKANYLGLPIPEILRDVLEQLHDKRQKTTDN